MRQTALLLLGFVIASTSEAHAADRFVSTLGSDTINTCSASATPCRTIGHVLTQAASGDTIKLAAGGYQESGLAISVATTLVLSGGWTPDFTSQSSKPAKTKLDARRQAPLLTITAAGTTLDVTLDTLTVSRGEGSGVVASSNGAGSLTLTIANCLFKSNENDYTDGGGIQTTSADTSSLNLAITGSTFKVNKTLGTGGAARVYATGTSSSSLSITDSTFAANSAQYGGGGVTASAESSASLIVSVDVSSFNRNRGAYPPSITGGHGGGMAVGGDGGSSSVTIVNSVFKGNTASTGGGLYANEIGSSIVNSSFRRNRASGGGGIWANNGSSMLLRNTIVWENLADGGGEDLAAAGTTIDADHTDIGDRVGFPGYFNDLGGNISADPLVTADLHLKTGSPAIDTGTCTGAPATDFEGDTRPMGTGCDMGADEFVP